MSSPYDPRGSLWPDGICIFTTSSFDYENRVLTNQQIVDGLLHHRIRVVAITIIT